MGLLSTLGSAAISSGLKYASDKYAADKHFDEVLSQNATTMNKVQAEHTNSLFRMKKDHDNLLDRMSIQHGYDLEKEKVRGQYNLLGNVVNGVATGVGAYIKSHPTNGGDKGGKSNGPKTGGSVPTSTVDDKWNDLVRRMNDATPYGLRPQPSNFHNLTLPTMLSTGAASASGIAGIAPLLAF